MLTNWVELMGMNSASRQLCLSLKHRIEELYDFLQSDNDWDVYFVRFHQQLSSQLIKIYVWFTLNCLNAYTWLNNSKLHGWNYESQGSFQFKELLQFQAALVHRIRVSVDVYSTASAASMRFKHLIYALLKFKHTTKPNIHINIPFMYSNKPSSTGQLMIIHAYFHSLFIWQRCCWHCQELDFVAQTAAPFKRCEKKGYLFSFRWQFTHNPEYELSTHNAFECDA